MRDLTYSKLNDLLDLAFKMQENSDGVSINDIENAYKISRRTAERMRDALLRYFPQMEEVNTGERIKRWKIPQRALNSLISFSSDDLVVFKTAIDCLKKNSLIEQAEALKRIETKVRNIINPNIKRRIEVDAEELMRLEGLALRPRPVIKVDESIVSTIREAILSNHQIKIEYQNKNSGKISHNIVDPYGFLYGERNHYFLARHSDGYFGNEIHTFILSNIKNVEIMPNTFVSDENFSLEEYAKGSFGIYREEPFECEWLFDKEVAGEAKNFIFHPDQNITENADGSLTVKFKTGGMLEMSWHLNTWGDKVKVIQPSDFWEKVKKC